MQKVSREESIPIGAEASSHRVELRIGGQPLPGNLRAILVRFSKQLPLQIADRLRLDRFSPRSRNFTVAESVGRTFI